MSAARCPLPPPGWVCTRDRGHTGPCCAFRRRYGVLHNLVAHPLLVLCPPLGRWLHERTEP